MTRNTPTVSPFSYFAVAAAGLLFFACLANTATAQNQPTTQPGVQSNQQISTLAVVNGESITRQQVAKECMRRFGEDTLEEIVNKLLVAEELAATGLTVTEKDVNDKIVQDAAATKMTPAQYIQLICEERALTVDQLKNDFVWKQLALRRLAEGKIQVSSEEINQRLEMEYGSRVQVRQIVVDSLEKAKQIQQMAAANPGEFERLAKQHSVEQTTASMGGLMPPIRRNTGFPEFEKAVFSLQEGQVSGIIPVQDVFVILRCEQIFPAEQIAPEHRPLITERIVNELTQEKLRSAAAQLFVELQAKSKVVNVMNDPELSKQMPGVAAVVNNRQILINKVAEDCITYFGRETLETEINRTILLQQLKQRGLQVEQSDLDAEIARAAEAAGYINDDGTPNVNAWLTFITKGDRQAVQFYVEDEVWPTVAMKMIVRDEVQVTKEDIQKGFEANYGPRVEVLAIVMNDQRRAQEVWRTANNNPDPTFFGELAATHSIDPMSRNNKGVIPPIRRFGGQPEIEEEAFSLRPGELSKLVQSGNNWVLLFCKGRTEPVVTDLDVVQEDIYKDILEKKFRLAMMSKFQQLRQAAQIDNFLVGTSQPGAAAVERVRQASSNANLPFRQQK